MGIPKTVKTNNTLEVSETTKRKYFRSLMEQVHALRQAMEKSDFDSIREICHRVRGSASLFGLKELGEACRWMEEASIQKKIEQLVHGFQIIEVIVSQNAGPTEVA